MQEYMIYEAKVDPELNSDLEVTFIGLVEAPAIEKNFQAFNEHKHKLKFVISEEKRVISGPVMIAGLPLYRQDDKLGEYYVVFNKPAIQAIVEKFSSKGYLTNFNLFHDPGKVDDITIFNSFIVDEELGIRPPANFEDLPSGSWFITAKVNNPDVWSRVKSGDIRGFSVEGVFSYVPVAKVKMSAEQLARKINRILSETEITD